MTAKPEFTRTISFGNVVQICLIIITATGAFAAVKWQANTNASEIAQIAAKAEENRKDAVVARADLEARIRRLENEQARADERFSSILGLLSRIDARLERIERNP